MKRHKLLFLTKINFGNKQNAGYLNKVRAQSAALRKNGIDVDLLYFRDLELVIESLEQTNVQAFGSRLSLLYHLYIRLPLGIKKGTYQSLYIRHFLTNPLFLISLALFGMKNMEIIMEVPTFPYSFEYKKWNKNKLLFWMDQFCSAFFLFFISRIVSFSFDKKIFGIRTITTDNGVDVDEINFNNKIPAFNDTLHILGLGNPRTWHAYERVLEGFKNYYKSPQSIKAIFEIVGQGGDLDKYQELVKQYGIEEYVSFHGFQTGKELDEIAEKCHVGIASLGMHRINVANGEASPLKSREFTARGLPFVTGYYDKGFPKDFPFIFNILSDETPLDITALLTFYQNIRQEHANYKEEMRKYALENLDWSIKMKVVSDYLLNAETV